MPNWKKTQEIADELDPNKVKPVVERKQESGEDYSARVHQPGHPDSRAAMNSMMDEEKRFLESEHEMAEWDPEKKTFRMVKKTGRQIRMEQR